MAVRARDTGEQGDTVRYTQDTEEGIPVRDWVFLGPPDCGTEEEDIGVKTKL